MLPDVVFVLPFFPLHSVCLNIDSDKSLNKNETAIAVRTKSTNMNGNESCQVVVAFVSYFFLSQMGNRTENFSPEKCSK